MTSRDGGEALFLIDGSSYLYRAYFAIRQPLTTRSGLPTKAVYGIVSMLWKVLREKTPTYAAILWDAKGPTFRHEIYGEYKTNRPPMPDDLAVQVPYVRKVVEAMGIVQLEQEGYEADDLMAAIAVRITGVPIIIVSGDKDLIQLVDQRVTIWDPMKDQVIDLEWVRKNMGIEPAQFRDVLALAGDPSDNIPGVPGIGQKTALKLIARFGSIEALLSHLDMLKGKTRERLEENAQRIGLWRRLVTLDSGVDVPDELSFYQRSALDHARLRSLFQELEFNTFLKDIVPEQTIPMDGYEVVSTPGELQKWCNRIKQKGHVVLDTETTSENPMDASLVGISICVEPPEAAYIPLAHGAPDSRNMEREALERLLAPLLADPEVGKTGQNIKYDLVVLERNGISLRGIEGDTMIASYLLNPTKRQHNLEALAEEVLGHRMITFKEVTRHYKGDGGFSNVPVEQAAKYSCEDVHVTALVKEVLWPKLKENGQWDLFTGIEMPLVPILADMEMRGVLVDRAGLRRLSEQFSRELEGLEREIYQAAGREFNVNSTKQLAEILFEELGLPQVKKTRKKTGYSTDMEVLKALAGRHPLPALMLRYRNLAKLKSTYVDGLEKMIHPETGRIHTSFNQTVTATGRLSSSNPNLQNIPVRSDEGMEIRSLFVAPEGFLLVSADYSQIDLRVLAHYSGDENLVQAFKRGEDIHTRTAALILGLNEAMVTPEMRRMAKTVNFGIVYGMSAYGLAKELGMDRKEAQRFIDKYFETYPGVKRYMERTVEEARKSGFVTTMLGRRRYIADINARNRNIREFAERTAINTPIQGTAADIIKLAMIEVDKVLRERFPRTGMILQVHDELVIEVPDVEAAAVGETVKEVMEGVVELRVPLVANVGAGRNWAEIK